MAPVLGVLALWVVFGGMHIALASGRIRAALVARLGEWGFMLVFSLVAAVSFSALVSFYAAHRFAGSAAPSFGAVVTGRQRVVWGELPFGAFALGAMFVVALRMVHASIFARGGVWIISTVLGGAAS